MSQAVQEMRDARDRIMRERGCNAARAMEILSRTKPELLQQARQEATDAAQHPSRRAE